MKTRTRVNAAGALTLIELLIVVAIVAVLLAMILPMRSGPRKSTRLTCMSNLRQIAIAFHMWAEDHEGRFPAQVSVEDNGTLEAIGTGSPAPHFQVLNKYIRNWSILVCPTDKSRTSCGTNTVLLTDTNLSYFVSVDAALSTTNALLSGDRHLAAAGRPGKPKLLTLTSNTVVSWTSELHKQSQRPGGNIVFVDGHAEWRHTNLASLIQSQGLTTNRLAMP
jgi:prepilin-type processing-associated H-X9-DG protein